MRSWGECSTGAGSGIAGIDPDSPAVALGRRAVPRIGVAIAIEVMEFSISNFGFPRSSRREWRAGSNLGSKIGKISQPGMEEVGPSFAVFQFPRVWGPAFAKATARRGSGRYIDLDVVQWL